MNPVFDAAALAFQREVRTFLEQALPSDIRDKVVANRDLTRADIQRWQRLLYERGWGAPLWPVKYGGTGWTPEQRYLFEDTCADFGAPTQTPVRTGVGMVGQVILRFGSDEQKARFLPPMARAEHIWSQGFSETEAGSDLAALRTRAVRDGGHYVVAGQKVWTAFAHFADWIFCLVRTDASGKKQEGITILLIDLKSAGITVRPIVTLDGIHELNEVFFDEVRVPVENRVGDENKGWTYAKYLLSCERLGVARVGAARRELRRLKELAATRHLLSDPRWRDRIATIEIDLLALELTTLRALAASSGETADADSSIFKLAASTIQQRLSAMMIELVGRAGLETWPEAPGNQDILRDPRVYMPAYLSNRRLTIFGGTREIQKNILAKTLLKL